MNVHAKEAGVLLHLLLSWVVVVIQLFLHELVPSEAHIAARDTDRVRYALARVDLPTAGDAELRRDRSGLLLVVKLLEELLLIRTWIAGVATAFNLFIVVVGDIRILSIHMHGLVQVGVLLSLPSMVHLRRLELAQASVALRIRSPTRHGRRRAHI